MQNTSLKLVSLGILLLVGSWAAKQIFLSWAVWAGGGTFDNAVLQADLRADWYEVTEEDRIELAKERVDKEPNQEKIRKLQDDIDDARDDIYEKDEVIEEQTEAAIDEVGSQATTINMVQWFLRLKILFDLAKVAAVFLMIKGALGLIQNSQMDSLTRWFGIGIAVVGLFSLLVTGVLSYLS